VPPLGKGGEEEAGGLQPSFRKKREIVKLTTSQQPIQEIPISRKRRDNKAGNKSPGISRMKAHNCCKKGGGNEK